MSALGTTFLTALSLPKQGGSIFSKGDREGDKAAADAREGQPAGQGGGGQ